MAKGQCQVRRRLRLNILRQVCGVRPTARSDKRHGHPISQRIFDGRAHDEVGVVGMPVDLFHHAVDFGHG